MRLVWTKTAVRDLTEIRNYIARDSPAAAVQMASRILDASDLLAAHPLMGREGRAPATRELVIAGADYIVIYRIRKKKLELLRVLHGKRFWPPSRK